MRKPKSFSNGILKPKVFYGGEHIDSRGKLIFYNDFDLSSIKRFYFLIHTDMDIVRAWQGQVRESKWFKCIKGRFVVAWKKIDNFSTPNDHNR